MDPELIEYLDRRFTQLTDELRTEIRAEIRTEIATSAEETRRHVDTAVASSAEETRRYVDSLTTETRRHFDVMAEHLIGKIQLVAEGVLGVDHKVDRLANEMRGEFQKVDRRFLHLQTRITDRRD